MVTAPGVFGTAIITTGLGACVDHVNEDLIWIVIDAILMVFILSGNILTIIAVWYYRQLQWVISNLFVLSLAVSDIFVGLTLPYHLAFYMGIDLGQHKALCLLRFFVLIMACSVSIWNLTAIAVDRYIAICYPLHYAGMMTKRTALTILASGWCLAILISVVPLIWNKWDSANGCEFDELLHPWYVAGVITPIFSVVWLCLFVVYWRIWREATKHAKQLRVHGGSGEQRSSSDWKSVQVVLLIMGCFTFCWIPYFVVVLTQMFAFVEDSSPTLYKAVFSLAMTNSMMNPIIYAWKNTHFRHAFKQFLTCHKPIVPNQDTHSVPSSAQQQPSLSVQKHQEQQHHQESYPPSIRVTLTNEASNADVAQNGIPAALANNNSLVSLSNIVPRPSSTVMVISQIVDGFQSAGGQMAANATTTTIQVSMGVNEMHTIAIANGQGVGTSDPSHTIRSPLPKPIIGHTIILETLSTCDEKDNITRVRQSARDPSNDATDPTVYIQPKYTMMCNSCPGATELHSFELDSRDQLSLRCKAGGQDLETRL